MKSKLNVIFMGSGLYGSSVLNSLDLSKIDILYVFTKYSKVKSIKNELLLLQKSIDLILLLSGDGV